MKMALVDLPSDISFLLRSSCSLFASCPNYPQDGNQGSLCGGNYGFHLFTIEVILLLVLFLASKPPSSMSQEQLVINVTLIPQFLSLKLET